jgi:hypothetical protein
MLSIVVRLIPVNWFTRYLLTRRRRLAELPWKSDDLSRLADVEPPGDDDRHTALDDARWAMRAWER